MTSVTPVDSPPWVSYHRGAKGVGVVNVTFYGVRGSTPCSSPVTSRYGGNTSCVAIEAPGVAPLLLDLGTGLRYFGATQPHDGTFRATALVSHLHWDHVQGLPFFAPIMKPGARLHVYGPKPHDHATLADAFQRVVGPPFFPVTLRDLPGEVTFECCEDRTFEVGPARVTARSVPHLGATNGYRVEWAGTVVTYISDHQQPMDGSMGVPDAVAALAEGADLLIHDAQFTPEEFADRPHWGHCTMPYALQVAKVAGARRLALYHHDPSRHDDALDVLSAGLVATAERSGVELVTAAEGLTISFDRAAVRAR
jgi:phosphoribosyl 1,2-cyclic phosphodiesterase